MKAALVFIAALLISIAGEAGPGLPPAVGPGLGAPYHAAGAPVGFAGAASGPTCHACHDDLELNEAEGRLEVVGFPGLYIAGRSYVVTLILRSEGMERTGFQATASGGAFAPLGLETVAMEDSVGRPYIGHGANGTLPQRPDQAQWMFEWVAPKEGDVVFHAAANSANGDNSPMGDFIYTATAEASETRRRSRTGFRIDRSW